MIELSRDGATVTRLVHTQEIAGSNPAPATMESKSSNFGPNYYYDMIIEAQRMEAQWRIGVERAFFLGTPFPKTK